MWTSPLTIALVAAGAAILGSLLTIFLTPWLQRHFWRKQRRDELRLAAINEFKRLTSEFLFEHVAAPTTYLPSPDWHKAFYSLHADIKPLFSAKAFDAFKAADVLIGPGRPGLGPFGNKTVDDFVQARDAALRALYAEVIPVRK